MRKIEHPKYSGFPFIELSGIALGNRMISCSDIEEIVACSPVEVNGGKGSYFNTVVRREGKVFVHTMMGDLILKMMLGFMQEKISQNFRRATQIIRKQKNFLELHNKLNLYYSC